MTVGALIGAYQEDDSGGLRALLPLAGRTLVEYQARCAAAAGAAPIVVLVERVPPALHEAFERLRVDGLSVIAVSDGHEAASRFEAGSPILLVGDGVAAHVDLLTELAAHGEAAIATVPDDPEHQEFERVDASSRWAGIAIVDARTLGATAAMLGDWDLQSTLLRKSLQDGALRVPVDRDREPLIANTTHHLAGFERGLIASSRGARRDWASRYLLGFVEEIATEHLMETRLRPAWLVWAALALTIGAAFSFSRGWLGAGMAMLGVSAPLDLIARRLGVLRLRPLPSHSLSRRLLWPAAGLAVLALGWRLTWHGPGWGALVTAIALAAFAEAMRIERSGRDVPGAIWLFSRRNAIIAAIPFAIAGGWTLCLAVLAVYAAASFFLVQHWHHAISRD